MINISVNVKDALKVVFQETKTIFIIPGESFSLLASKLSPLVCFAIFSVISDYLGYSYLKFVNQALALAIIVHTDIYQKFRMLHGHDKYLEVKSL